MLVLVNGTAGGGRAERRWEAIEPDVRRAAAGFAVSPGHPRSLRIERPASTAEVDAALRDALAGGERHFVAAGGDGTVNRVLSRLADHAARGADPDGELVLGAIGLGSSNDFHKPRADRDILGGIPLRIDPGRTFLHDVGFVRWRDPAGRPGRAWWIVNASVGVAAEANDFFNHPDALLRVLKRRATGPALAYAALRTIVTWPGRVLGLRIGASPECRLAVANLGVVKNPHFAGCLRYDGPCVPDDGRFDVHLLRVANVPRLAAALAGLSRGRFSGRPGTISFRTDCLAVRSREPFALETDGEVRRVRAAEFGVAPFRIRVCR